MLAERALGVGSTEILKKPVQSRDMAAALARVLSHLSSRPRLATRD
jgi:hypothetical protein